MEPARLTRERAMSSGYTASTTARPTSPADRKVGPDETQATSAVGCGGGAAVGRARAGARPASRGRLADPGDELRHQPDQPEHVHLCAGPGGGAAGSAGPCPLLRWVGQWHLL